MKLIEGMPWTDLAGRVLREEQIENLLQFGAVQVLMHSKPVGVLLSVEEYEKLLKEARVR